MYRLLFENLSPAREPFVTSEPLVWIGRESSCQLRLAEAGVSDRHGAIERREDGYYVRDAGGANPVRINGQPVARQRLTSGDELELGSVRLRFEILHQPPPRRRPVDLLQWAAGAVIAATILGQMAVMQWIFSQPHTRGMRLDTTRARASAPPVLAPATGPGALFDGPASAPRPAPATAVAPTVPAVLNRMIRIVRADTSMSLAGVTLTIQAKAQVGERALEVSATAISVQFFGRNVAADPVPPPEPLWVNIGTWENFSSKTFAVKWAGAPERFGGFVVRTFYRGQLQDVAAAPQSLLALAPLTTP